jgi:hypothetical protein
VQPRTGSCQLLSHLLSLCSGPRLLRRARSRLSLGSARNRPGIRTRLKMAESTSVFVILASTREITFLYPAQGIQNNDASVCSLINQQSSFRLTILLPPHNPPSPCLTVLPSAPPLQLFQLKGHGLPKVSRKVSHDQSGQQSALKGLAVFGSLLRTLLCQTNTFHIHCLQLSNNGSIRSLHNALRKLASFQLGVENVPPKKHFTHCEMAV